MQSKGVALRRRTRGGEQKGSLQEENPSTDTPVPIVFRVHNDNLSKSPFLFNPKNFNLSFSVKQEAPTECIVEVRPAPAVVPFPHNASYTKLTGVTSSAVLDAMGSRLDLSSLSSIPSTADLPAIAPTEPMTMKTDPVGRALYVHPSGGWICRLMCSSEREANYASGAISISQSQMGRCSVIGEAAKGRAVATVLSRYDEVKTRYGLSHLKLSCIHQYLSRSDQFTISELLRDQILYHGEEIVVSGFHLQVSDMLYRDCGRSTATAPSSSTPTVDRSLPEESKGSVGGASPPRLLRVSCGVVTAQTNVNFDSRSPVYYIVIELSREMWDTTIDGRVTMSWTFRKFLRQLLSKEMVKRKVYPLLRILFTGRLRKRFSIHDHRDVLHLLEVSTEERSRDIAVEAELHCDAFVERLLRDIQKDKKNDKEALKWTPKDIFVLSKNSNTLETLSVVLERCGMHYTDRRLNTTGHTITIVSAGKCLYRVTNSLVQVITARLHDVGLEKVHVICIGRPPLHATPLFEYKAADDTLRSQYHLHSEMQDPTQLFYETPVWLSVLFFYPHLEGGTTEVPFMLLNKEEWIQLYQTSFSREPLEYRAASLDPDSFPRSLIPSAFINGQQVLLPGLGLPYHSLGLGVVYPAGSQRLFSEHGAAKIATNISPTVEHPRKGNPSTRGLVRGTWYVLHSAKTSAHFPQYHLGDTRRTEPQSTNVVDTYQKSIPPCTVTKQKTVMRSDAAPCGLNIIDSDLKNGYLVLELTLVDDLLPSARWSPSILESGATWSQFLSCFEGRDGRVQNVHQTNKWSSGNPEAQGPREGTDPVGPSVTGEDFFVSSFRPSEVFCHSHSGVSEDGKTLILPTHNNRSTFQAPEVVSFQVEPFMLVLSPPSVHSLTENSDLDEELPEHRSTTVTAAPSREDLSVVPSDLPEETAVADLLHRLEPIASLTALVGYVQLRSSLLFSLKAVDPLCGSDPSCEELHPTSSENISTSVVFKRRWLFKHPDLSGEPPHIRTWTDLCTCNTLPVYGARSAYPRDAFYSVPPHQYTMMEGPISIKGQLTEFVIQRLQQQYQLVVDSASENATYPLQWPRESPTPNARVELSAGHQLHILKIGETLQTLSVTRMLHRGMYSNDQVTHRMMYEYLLWNYLSDDFSQRKVYLEAQVGEKDAYSWEVLDRWLQNRPNAFIPTAPDVCLKPREVALVLVPLDATKLSSFDNFLKFISYRFSALLSVRGQVEWQPDERQREVRMQRDACTLIERNPDSMNSGLESLMHVILSHETTLQEKKVGARVAGLSGRGAWMEDRLLSVDIALPPRYHPQCCYTILVSWLVCTSSIVADWYGSFITNAGRHGFAAVPIPCGFYSAKTDYFNVHWDAVVTSEERVGSARQRLCEALLEGGAGYYPNGVVMDRRSRFVHFSGLCYIIIPYDYSKRVVAQWFQNSLVATGTMEQKSLLSAFIALTRRVLSTEAEVEVVPTSAEPS